MAFFGPQECARLVLELVITCTSSLTRQSLGDLTGDCSAEPFTCVVARSCSYPISKLQVTRNLTVSFGVVVPLSPFVDPCACTFVCVAAFSTLWMHWCIVLRGQVGEVFRPQRVATAQSSLAVEYRFSPPSLPAAAAAQQRRGVCRVLGLVHRTGGGFED